MKRMVIAAGTALLLAACQNSGSGSNSAQPAPAGAQITGAGSTFVYPVLSAWAADYQKQTGTKRQLSVDRFGRRYLAGQGGHGRLRRDRPAARRDELAKSRPCAIPDRHRRHRPGREHRRPRAGQAQAHRPAARRHLCRQVKKWNDPAIAKLNPGVTLPDAASPSSIAPTARAPPSTSPIISARSARPGRAARAKARRSTGRPASAARAMRASPATSSRSPIRSAMSNMPMCCRTT